MDNERKCQWPGCGEKAEVYLKGLEHEHLCTRQTAEVSNTPELIAFRSAIEEAEDATFH
jgi:hypothetical protein